MGKWQQRSVRSRPRSPFRPRRRLALAHEPTPDSVDRLSAQETSAVVRAALASLPAEQVRALELAFFGGLTQREIATRLAEPLGTVKARLRRGLFKLRDVLALRHD